MPPWLPEPGHGDFIGARRLSKDELATLSRWVEQDTPLGDAELTPPVPTFASGWHLGSPDLVLDTGTAYELAADGKDIYRNFVIPVPEGQMRFVRALEIVPADPQVVHHAVLRIDMTGSVRQLAAKDPLPGFDGMVFAGAGMPDGRFLGWTPGKLPSKGSDDRAWRLQGGSDLVLQLHLRPSGKVEPVTAKVGLHFASRPPTRPALSIELSATKIDLPAGARDVHVTDAYRLPIDVSILSVYPHAHYLGKQVDGWAELPDGSRRDLVKIKDWDFDWQDEYRFKRPVSLPAGSTIHMDWSFDNSADNPHNPVSPPRDVAYGQASTDEMAELILEVEPADPRQLGKLDADFRRKWMADQVAALQRIAAASPNDPDAAANLAAMRQHTGDSKAAIAQYERALKLDPKHARSNHELGIVLLAAGDIPRAVDLLRQACELAPKQAGPHLVLANALRKQGKADEAIKYYRIAIKLDGTSANAHNNLGIVLESQGDLKGAAAVFARAAQLQPRQPVFQRNLARVKKAGG